MPKPCKKHLVKKITPTRPFNEQIDEIFAKGHDMTLAEIEQARRVYSKALQDLQGVSTTGQ